MTKEFHNFESVTRCDLCESEELISVYKPSDIQECNRCHFVFASPRPTFEEIERSYSEADFYSGWIKESTGRKKLWKKRFNRVKNFTKPGFKILDYSAGIGTFLQFAKANGLEAYGTEISNSAKRIAKENYSIDLQNEETLLSNERMGFYEVITGWHILEHVESPSDLLRRFHNALTTDGVLVLAVPNINHRTLKQLALGKPNSPSNLYPILHPGGEIHLSHFSEQTLTALLEKCGFKLNFLGIDDHFANPGFKTTLKYSLYSLLRIVTGKNWSETIFAVAIKK